MSDVFNQLRYNVGLGFDFTSADVRACLLLRDTWTPDVDDDVVATATVAGATIVSNRITLTGTTVTLNDSTDHGVWDCSVIPITGVANLDDYDTFLLYNFVTNDADSWLMAWTDLGAQVGDGTTLNFTPNALGLFLW